MKRKIVIAAVVLLTLVAGYTVHVLTVAGAFVTIEPHGPEATRIISGFPGGAEDIVLRPGTTQAFVSSADFRNPTKRGGIFLVDLATGEKRDVTPDVSFGMGPHGIDLLVREDGSQRLFVVNHRNGSGLTMAASDVSKVQHTIDIYDVADDGSLEHVESVRGDDLFSPNDVAAVGDRVFYVTNDHGWDHGLPRLVEDYLRLPLANVVYFDGSVFEEVHSGAIYANGVLASPDRQHLYLAETGGTFTRFRRELDGSLKVDWQKSGLGGLDNISFDDGGAVWIGTHPKLLDFVAYAADPSRKAPTQVLRLTPDASGYVVDEVYLSDGDPLSGASVAVPFSGGVALGGVFQSDVIVLPPIR